jgi:hypothetical protein
MKIYKPTIPQLHLVLCLCLFLFLHSCHTFITANGTKHRQLFPSKVKDATLATDTNKYHLQRFSYANYENKNGFVLAKKLVEVIGSSDIEDLRTRNGKYYLVFWDPQCPKSSSIIRKCDSLLKTGEQILLVSLRNDCELIDRRLKSSLFNSYPYYTIGNSFDSKVMLRRKISFIKQCCIECYESYRDDVAVADYLLVENGAVKSVLYNDTSNILKK